MKSGFGPAGVLQWHFQMGSFGYFFVWKYHGVALSRVIKNRGNEGEKRGFFGVSLRNDGDRLGCFLAKTACKNGAKAR